MDKWEGWTEARGEERTRSITVTPHPGSYNSMISLGVRIGTVSRYHGDE